MVDDKCLKQEVEETLRGFDAADRLKADPYLMTRLQAEIDELERERDGVSARIRRFAPQLALGLIIAVNAMVGVSVFIDLGQSESARQIQLEAFGETYGLSRAQETFLSVE